MKKMFGGITLTWPKIIVGAILTGIYVDDGKFVHENLHSFFEEKGGYKQFTLAQGKEWTGGDSIDDYC